MPYSLRITTLAGALALAALATSARADWPSIHRTAGNNAVVPISTSGTPLAQTARWSSVASDYYDVVRPILFDGKLIVVAANDGGTPYNEVDDSLKLRALDAASGAQLWESVALDVGVTVSYLSTSTPTIDTTNRRIYFASGSSMQKLDVDTGAVVWSTALTAANTAAGRAFKIVNSSPSLGAGLIFVQASEFASTTQVVAFNPAGAVVWSQPTTGWGAIAPVFADLGPGQQYVYIDTVSGGAGLQCRDALTGALVWDHMSVSTPWALTGNSFVGIWTEPLLDSGSLYAITYDTSSNGKLARIDAATGNATTAGNYIVPSIGTDTPPVLLGGSLYAIGGTYGDADLVVYSAATGTATTTVDIGEAVYRNYMAASNDRLYFTQTAVGLKVRDLTGALVPSGPLATTMTGPVTLDEAGNVYLYNGGKVVSFGLSSAVSDWMQF